MKRHVLTFLVAAVAAGALPATAAGAGQSFASGGITVPCQGPTNPGCVVAFNAHQDSNGSLGHWEINAQRTTYFGTGFNEGGHVTCVNIHGNEAWFTVRIEHSSVPSREGILILVHAVDNGDPSASGSPDLYGQIAWFDPNTCPSAFAVDEHPTDGNIVVRDGS